MDNTVEKTRLTLKVRSMSGEMQKRRAKLEGQL